MNPTIATFLCVDTEAQDASSFYPELGGKRPAEVRRALYWKNVIVFCATARRCNPDARIVVVTNDTADITCEGKPLQNILDELDVEKCFTPFREFKPPLELSARFLNIFYRYDVIRALGYEIAPEADTILLMDSDCVWAHPVMNWDALLLPKTLLISNPYGERKTHERHPDRLSRADMGTFYRQLDTMYPEKFPNLFGGELIGGSAETLRMFYQEVKHAWMLILDYAKHTPPRLANGLSIFDSDEYVNAYVYNRGTLATRLEPKFFRRVYTQEFPNTARHSDLDIAVWHVPGEKERGLVLLFAQVVQSDSMFWKTPLENYPHYLGSFVGIPRRQHDMPYPTLKRAERHARAFVRRLRHYKNIATANL
jgi:hypothetical protein